MFPPPCSTHAYNHSPLIDSRDRLSFLYLHHASNRMWAALIIFRSPLLTSHFSHSHRVVCFNVDRPISSKCGADAYTTLRHITPSHQLALPADRWHSTSFQYYPSVLYPLQSARVVLLHLLRILHLTRRLLADHWFINACLPNGLLILKSTTMWSPRGWSHAFFCARWTLFQWWPTYSHTPPSPPISSTPNIFRMRFKGPNSSSSH